ncbi:NUDIX hydrolase [Paenibacillus alkalitolerans]|uniref:NUDIX hydrolase n=1 Tax=Paenibacillus alkalitolerans TaxID=2799335 RepID=UPI001F1EA234|nr:NUDIX hydrolase [Paenibacillus alkalitolerans]
MKRTTVGLLLTDGTRFLACHSTGNRFYDLPKGLPEEGESALETCRREVREETGLDISGIELNDFGVLPYTREKNLHLFVWRTSQLPDTGGLVCTSFFPHPYTGKSTPEVDGYKYIDFHEKELYLAKSMVRTLSIVEDKLLIR